MTKSSKNIALFFILSLIIFGTIFLTSQNKKPIKQELPYSLFIEQVKASNVYEVSIV